MVSFFYCSLLSAFVYRFQHVRIPVCVIFCGQGGSASISLKMLVLLCLNEWQKSFKKTCNKRSENSYASYAYSYMLALVPTKELNKVKTDE